MQYPFIEESEAEQFKKHKFQAYYWWVMLHKLLGYSTGQIIVKSADSVFNFNTKNPPINPLNRKPIST